MIEKVGAKCCGCSACTSVCPKNCITMKEDAEGFLFPKVDEQLCVHCGLCQKACPVLHLPNTGNNMCREAWGVTCRDEELLFDSSSGGLFTLLAQEILVQEGCVYGTAFSSDFKKAVHIKVTDRSELRKLRGSKYLQSDINSCYNQTKQDLINGRKVLFSGTPCQIAGLKGYLGREYENLICVDIICHGVPSPALWKTYLSHIEQQMDGKASVVSFRHKKNGWRKFGLFVENSKSQCYLDLYKDPYLRMFLKNDCLRESCYQCSMKGTAPVSDITIGDFWGVEKVSSELNNDMGVSLALLHTSSGRELFTKVRSAFDGGLTDYNKAIQRNSAYNHSVRRPIERDLFFSDLRDLNWEKFVKKYGRDKLKVRIKRAIKASIIWKLRL